MESFHAVVYLFFLSSVCTSAYGVARCPIISNLGDVIATGNTEKATSGDVIHFECESPKILDGPKDIHCQDNGQWSGPIPKCIGVICLPPEISHGFSDPNKVYKENNILQYRCDSGYTPRHGNSWCTKSGWSIKPECEEMICLLGALTPGIASTNPKGKNIFKVGEDVEIICSNSPWLFERTHESRRIKCQANGNWEVSPGCEEPICEYPRGEHLLYPPEPNHRMLYTFKERIQYRCEPGFKGTAANITCTENDWEPKPQCTVVRCPTISNLGNVIATGNTEEASYGDVIHFKCASPMILDGPENINCTENGQWSGTVPKCKKTTCLIGAVTPGVSTNPRGKNIFQVGEHVEIICSKSHWLLGTKHESRKIKCQDGGEWESRLVCEEPICEYPRDQHLSYPPESHYRNGYKLKESIQYGCEEGYKSTAAIATCTENGWEPKSLCTEITCQLGARTPGIASTSPRGKNIFRAGERVTITCEKNYWVILTKQASQTIKCGADGNWESSPVCEEITCLLGARTSGIASTSPPGKNIFKVGEYVTITCEKNYRIFWTTQVSQQIKCQDNGKFESSPVCEEITCGYPRGQHLSYPSEYYYKSKQYKLKESIQYRCERGYKKTATHATCTENGWDPELLCTEMTCEYPRGQHMLPPSGQYIKRYKLKESIQYQCEDGYKGTAATCTENGWEPRPQCTEQEKTACEKPFVQNWFITQEKNKEYFYTCGSGYKPFDEKWWEVLSCSNEQQRNPPLCIPDNQCGQIPDIHTKHFQEKKGYENEAILKFDCKPEPCCFKCINGNWEKEDCKSTSCGTPPYVENAAIKFNSEQEVEYLCQEKFEINGNQIIFCTNDEWDQTPTCKQLESCPEPERKINNATMVKNNLKVTYQDGDTLEYKCIKDFQNEFLNETQAICSKGQWNYPRCIHSCPEPEGEKNNATLVRNNLKMTYQDGDTLKYKCIEDFQNEFQNETQAICSKGQWNYPQCINPFISEK